MLLVDVTTNKLFGVGCDLVASFRLEFCSRLMLKTEDMRLTSLFYWYPYHTINLSKTVELASLAGEPIGFFWD